MTDYFVWTDDIAPKVIRDQSCGGDATRRFVARTNADLFGVVIHVQEIKPDCSARFTHGGNLAVIPKTGRGIPKKKFTPIPKVRGWESPYGWPKSPLC